jgi:hypothetical protein
LNSGHAERLEEIGALLAAGVDTDRALGIVGAGDRRGPVTEHLVEQGLVLPQELPMIERMLEVGRLDRGLRHLGSDLRREARVVGRIAGRLALPVAMWAIAILIAPLPALFGHRRHDVPLLSAGETAGRLLQALDHRVGQLCEERDLRMEVVAEWLPRGVYFLMLLHLARGFL